jgi:hypothetical protein
VTAVVFLLKAAPPLGSDPTKRSWRNLVRQIGRLDFIGAILVAGAVTNIVLALQWGGNTKAWNDKAVIIVRCCPMRLGSFSFRSALFSPEFLPLRLFPGKSILASEP